MDKFKIVIELIDWWIEDKIDRGYKPIKLFMLLKIGNKIILIERLIKE